jgi:hypothetical protein
MSFCINCGAELGTNAMFCHVCGASVSSEVKKVKKGEDYSTQPVFVPIVVFMRFLPLGLFFGIWLGGFLGIFGAIWAQKMSIPPLWGFIVPGIIGFSFGFFGFYFSTKNNYKKTVYEFLDDRLIYYDGFWSRSKKELLYRSIREIGYNESIFQRKYNLGTIVVSTPATDKKAGLYLKDIQDVEAVYAKFREKYNACVG